MSTTPPPTGPDLTQGVSASSLLDGESLLGQVDGHAVLLVRTAGEFFAVDATCTHYSGPLAEGLVVLETIRCPWHHACYDLRTGEAVGAPALNPLTCWAVEHEGEKLFVRKPRPPEPTDDIPDGTPASIVIIGAGAAGESAAENLRRTGYTGTITLYGADPADPVDRPNLSKDYLAGTAEESWIPLRPPEWFTERRIDVQRGATVTAIETVSRTITLATGRTVNYGALLIATGAEPVHLAIPGGERAMVLRTLADSKAIIARARAGQKAVVLGASFIALEAAAALRTRGVEVHVAAPDARPLERILGPELGDFIRRLHESHGVVFHLGQSARTIDASAVTLDSGEQLAADFVVAGVGVRPNVALAEAAGLTVDRGIVVDRYLQTSAAGVYAAGDVARFPDPRSGALVRIEHWALAQRQGRAAARNMVGLKEPFTTVPFFWSQHYDLSFNYVGHAEKWDRIEITGDLDRHDATVAYRLDGKVQAVVTLFRDQVSLEAESALERDDHDALEAVLARG
jgi:3-phenylpropionate/trans-cinnamate dioxygenase ferredoxin reductase subunit